MFAIHHFRLFVITVLLINITPGATFLAVTSNAISRGIKAGVATSVGAACGLLIYAILSWQGLSTLITGSVFWFNIVRYAGVFYLFYCGVRAFMQPPFDMEQVTHTAYRESFKKGLFVNLLNPFSLVFFLTLIPQFVNTSLGDTSSQILFMGLWISFSALTVNILLSFLFGSFSTYLTGKPLFWKYLKILTGTFFIYLAIRFAFLR